MKQAHYCEYHDLFWNDMMHRWECSKCRRIFSKEERKVLKNALMSAISLLVR